MVVDAGVYKTSRQVISLWTCIQNEIKVKLCENSTKKEVFRLLFQLVAGAVKVCKWKYTKQVVKASSASIISWIKKKKEFTKHSMEKFSMLSAEQCTWCIKDLLRKGIIKRTRRFEYRAGKGNRRAIYKYIGN